MSPATPYPVTFFATFEKTAIASEAGLYDEDGIMTMSWDELKENDYLVVEDGTLTQGSNEEVTALSGILKISDEVTIIGSNSRQAHARVAIWIF